MLPSLTMDLKMRSEIYDGVFYLPLHIPAVGTTWLNLSVYCVIVVYISLSPLEYWRHKAESTFLL